MCFCCSLATNSFYVAPKAPTCPGFLNGYGMLIYIIFVRCEESFLSGILSNKMNGATVKRGVDMTDAEYNALYKKAEDLIVKRYSNLATDSEKTMLFKKITKMFVENSGGMTLLAIIMSMEN